MTYVVLARKYRPQTFSQLVGQEVVTRVLTGALNDSRLGHAYLFCGPRGTGKTTTARILAKCLNCESGPTPEPCGTCDRCQGADMGNEPDIIELDAASHTGVDHIRALRDEVAYAPMRARFKVYIVDEVHMLSKQAFNALLKTLEEPPQHVVFLFATTEPHKVIDTIISRCQVLRLDPISEEQIAGHLDEVFRQEGISAAPGVTQELARGARGGMRDALSLADKLLALAGDKPTLEDLQRLGGGGGTRAVDELLDSVESQGQAQLLETIAGHPGGEGELVDALLARLRAGVVLAHCGEETPLVPGSPEDRAAALKRVQRIGVARVELWMQELLRCRERMRSFPGQERVILEVALLELARAESTWTLTELAQRIEALAAALSGGRPLPASAATLAQAPAAAPSAAPSAAPAPAPTAPVSQADIPTPPRPSAPEAASSTSTSALTDGDVREWWKRALVILDRGQGAFAELLRTAAKPRVTQTGIDILIGDLDEKSKRMTDDRRSRSALSRALTEVAGRTLELRFVTDRSTGQAAPRPPQAAAPSPPDEAPQDPAPAAAPASPQDSPPVQDSSSRRTSQARNALPPRKPAAGTREKDGFTQEVADVFGGVVEDL